MGWQLHYRSPSSCHCFLTMVTCSILGEEAASDDDQGRDEGAVLFVYLSHSKLKNKTLKEDLEWSIRLMAPVLPCFSLALMLSNSSNLS